MIWLLLSVCFCNIITGNGDNMSLLPLKENSKSGNTIARRILEEIRSRDDSEQVDILVKGRNGHSALVTSELKEQAGDNSNHTSVTEETRDKENKLNLKQLKSVTRAMSITPENLVIENFFENSTVLTETNAKVPNNTKNTNGYSDMMKTERDIVSHINNLNKSIEFDESDESELTDRINTKDDIKIPESNINVTAIPLQIERVYIENTTKKILRSLENNKKDTKSSKNIEPNKPNSEEMKLRAKTRYYIKTEEPTSLDANNKNQSAIHNLQKPSQNSNTSRIDLTFIQNLNINSHNTNSYKYHEDFGQNKNKTNKYYEAHKLATKKQSTAKVDTSKRETNLFLSKIRPLLRKASRSDDVYSPLSEESYSRMPENSKKFKDDVTPISLDYYFDKNNNGKESEIYDEVMDPVREESMAISRNNPVLTSSDQNADTFGRSRNEVVLKVLRDMISMDSEPIVAYPWLKSVLEVRSGILKIMDLIQTYVYYNKIHPLDLELLKYLLYLYKSSNMKLQIKESGPYSSPELSKLGVNTQRVPVLTDLFKNIKQVGPERLSRMGPAVEDQQLTILFGLQDFLNEVLLLLNGFHRVVQESAKHDSNTHLYDKLKEEYLSEAEDPHLRVVLLHLSLARLFKYIDSSADRVREGFYNYVQRHPEEVKRDREETVFILTVLEQLRWK